MAKPITDYGLMFLITAIVSFLGVSQYAEK